MTPFGKSFPVRLSWEESGTLFILPFDACTLETHTLASTISFQPLESGSSVTDHVTQEPDVVSLSGIYSNTPLLKITDIFRENSPLNTAPGAVTLGAGASSVLEPRRGETLLEELIRLKENAILLTAHTNIRMYEDMIISSVNVPRDAARGGSVFVDLILNRVQFAESLVVASESPAAPTQNKGRKSKQQPTPQEAESGGSFLDSLTGAGIRL